ncbi:MAG: hypothetical protein KC619_19580 [Myxococcales bacterium]|nr:hypothetical protein [Myxococcales bacterium]
MDAHDRVLYVQILAQMLIADGVLADDERAHLDRVAASLGMPEEEKQEALRGVSIDSPVEERVEALSADAKKNLLAEVKKALSVHGEMSNSEKWFLERVEKLVS